MRDIFVTGQFQKDLKKVYAGYTLPEKNLALRKELALVMGRLLFDVQLEIKHKDHKLSGDWNGFRDCHVFNDLVLIYRKYDKKDNSAAYGECALVFARLGSHSALGIS